MSQFTIDTAAYSGDIVARLLNWRGLHLAHGGELFEEAAREIGRLREAIRRLAEQDATLSVCNGNVTVTMDATPTDAEREAVEYEAGEEVKRLRSVIDRAAAAWMRCDGVEWEGDLADAVEAGVREIKRLRAQRNHWMAAARAFDDHLATMRVMFMEQPGYWDKTRAT